MSLFKNIDKFKKNTFAIDGKVIFSYEDILNNHKKFNVFKRSICFLLCENSIGFLKIYVNLMRNNAIIFMLNKELSEASLQNLIKRFKPNFLFCSNKKKFASFKQMSKFDNYYIYHLKKKVEIVKKKIAIILPSSGSISSSKYIMLSHENLINNIKSIKHYLKIKQNDRAITLLQPYYSYGLSVINSHIYSGASIVINNSTIFNLSFWHSIKKNKVTNFNGVPEIYRIIVKYKFFKLIKNHVRYLTLAGGSLDKNNLKKIIKFCEKNKVNFYNMYGQTEASPRIAYIELKDLKKNMGSIGKAVRGGKLIIENKILSFDKKLAKGELVYKGKNIMLGYCNNLVDIKKKSKEIKKLNTGDYGYKNKSNFFFITGRIDRLIKINSIRYNLDEIENILNNINIKSACIKKKNYIHIYVERETSLKKILKVTDLPSNILRVIKIKKLPYLSNFKLNYSKLYREYE